MTTSIRRLRLGSCPDSWGVWFADDPRQTPWQRFLDELSGAGYRWLELGPYGYLPTDPARLRDELAKRDLSCAGGTVAGVGGPHKDFADVVAETRKVAELTRALGAENLIFVPVPGYRDDATGAYHEPAELSPERWRALVDNSNTLGRILAEEYGLAMRFHPHADYHVETQEQTERFLADTDPRWVSLCLDTGHLAYRGADVPALVRKHPDRIGYVHIKQMDRAVADRAAREDLPFGQAVAQGASVEPPAGAPDVPSVLTALGELDADLFVVVEQDMYPVDFDVPLPIATRTRAYLNSMSTFEEEANR
ncbi:TIM barrel protein [Couchioplanes caeruleus]|uniref:2-keto-myo-inositol dehydratase n=2 Tax=Couchioplanes caeruleus TaxID=56438 RepID=A0A1K0FP68_9ACTN|nr:TIM barrel protein [Couchioplanes caeruleus]OJF14637.1 2-keto-myo-inositol dehydratase [Couchioplanes caeruleus subsp. caeruleus]ROP34449.1 2-keto-myo-inositol dehydratase [Couchioplanes caeruleus]